MRRHRINHNPLKLKAPAYARADGPEAEIDTTTLEEKSPRTVALLKALADYPLTNAAGITKKDQPVRESWQIDHNNLDSAKAQEARQGQGFYSAIYHLVDIPETDFDKGHPDPKFQAKVQDLMQHGYASPYAYERYMAMKKLHDLFISHMSQAALKGISNATSAVVTKYSAKIKAAYEAAIAKGIKDEAKRTYAQAAEAWASYVTGNKPATTTAPVNPFTNPGNAGSHGESGAAGVVGPVGADVPAWLQNSQNTLDAQNAALTALMNSVASGGYIQGSPQPQGGSGGGVLPTTEIDFQPSSEGGHPIEYAPSTGGPIKLSGMECDIQEGGDYFMGERLAGFGVALQVGVVNGATDAAYKAGLAKGAPIHWRFWVPMVLCVGALAWVASAKDE